MTVAAPARSTWHQLCRELAEIQAQVGAGAWWKVRAALRRRGDQDLEQRWEDLLERAANHAPDDPDLPSVLLCWVLDGPGFVAWLKRVGYRDPQDNAIKRWQKGEDASLKAADARVAKLGLHLSQIPDDLWKDHE